MRQKRRNFTAAFKTNVVLEALKERETIQQLAVKFEVHPNQITTWKKQFLSNAGAAFDKSDSNEELEQTRAQLDELYKQNGQMKVETDWLKKSCCNAAQTAQKTR